VHLECLPNVLPFGLTSDISISTYSDAFHLNKIIITNKNITNNNDFMIKKKFSSFLDIISPPLVFKLTKTPF
jgi:hypothetical protein